jgi:hypothetical protein
VHPVVVTFYAITKVASERQIAANRRNAQKSTGPRSVAGKRRARRNAYRHGLGAADPLFGSGEAKEFEAFVRSIAGDHAGPLALSIARDVARAEFQLAKIRRVKVALINRVWTFGSLDSALDPPLLTAREITNWEPILEATGRFLKPPDVEASMPSAEPERTAEAVARAGPALLRLDRYEQRATASRNRAVMNLRELSAMSRGDQKVASTQNVRKK